MGFFRKEKKESPVEQRRREKEAERRRLEREIVEQQKFLEQAPRLRAEAEQREREELIAKASRTEARFGTGNRLADPRFSYEVQVATLDRQRRLKRERRKGMLTFFFLSALLVAIWAWLYFEFVRPR